MYSKKMTNSFSQTHEEKYRQQKTQHIDHFVRTRRQHVFERDVKRKET